MAVEAKKALSKAQAAVMSVFAADAFSLSYHWVYDLSLIPRPIEAKLHEPASKFHKEKGKAKGDFTHIGDQVLLLARHLQENKQHQFDVHAYATKFGDLFNEGYKGWLTGYTKNVLQQLKDKVPADKISTAIGDTDPIGRIAPLFLHYKSAEDLVPVAKQYVSFTNNTPLIASTTEFFTHVTFKVLGGKTPVAAIEEVVKSEPFSKSEELVEIINKGLASKNDDTTAAIKAFGQSCEIEAGVPGAVHLIAKYENDLTKLLEANAGAGGDSSPRALIAALVVGAHLGEAGIPSYAKEMNHYDEVLNLIH